MPQRELQFVPLHGENTADSFGQHFVRVAEMRRTFRSPQIINHVFGRNDTQSGIKEDRRMENGFVISFPRGTMIPAKVDKPFLVFAFFDIGIQLMQVERIVQEGIMLVPLIQHSLPTSPTGNRERGREEVIIGHILRHLIIVHAGNHTDTSIVFILVQQLFAEREKRQRGNIIILQYDTFIHMREGPFLGHIFRRITTVILFLIKLLNFTFPVYILHNFPAS